MTEALTERGLLLNKTHSCTHSLPVAPLEEFVNERDTGPAPACTTPWHSSAPAGNKGVPSQRHFTKAGTKTASRH